MRAIRSGLTAALCALALAITAAASTAAPPIIFVRKGFLDGEGYLEMAEDRRTAYVMGVLDGFSGAPFFGAPDDQERQVEAEAAHARLSWLNACTEGMSSTQTEEIASRYVRDHPERWHHWMNALIYSAFVNACPPSKEVR